MIWLMSGIIVYSMLIGVTVVSLLTIVKSHRKRDRSAKVDEQSRGLTHSRTNAVGVLLFLILFSTLAVFVVTETPRHKRVDNALPVIAVYDGLIQSVKVDKDFHEVTGPIERTIRTQADYEAFVAQIPLRQITKTSPAPPSKDPLFKKPFIDFAKHMVLIAIRTDSMYVCSHIESLVLDGQTFHVHVLDPDLGETRFLNQMRDIGTYRAVVVPQHTGPTVQSQPPREHDGRIWYKRRQISEAPTRLSSPHPQRHVENHETCARSVNLSTVRLPGH